MAAEAFTHNHGRNIHGRQPAGKLVLKVANGFCHHNELGHVH